MQSLSNQNLRGIKLVFDCSPGKANVTSWQHLLQLPSTSDTQLWAGIWVGLWGIVLISHATGCWWQCFYVNFIQCMSRHNHPSNSSLPIQVWNHSYFCLSPWSPVCFVQIVFGSGPDLVCCQPIGVEPHYRTTAHLFLVIVLN